MSRSGEFMRVKRGLIAFAAALMVVMSGEAALAAVGIVAPPFAPDPTAPAIPTPASRDLDSAAAADVLGTSAAADTDATQAPAWLMPASLGLALATLDVADPVDRPHYEFTAHQRAEIVDGDPAVNGYWGTSKPGSVVTVKSRFGRGRAETNDDGKRELKVEFPTAPCNEWFKVVATSGDHQQAFEMKRACRVDVVFTAHQQYGECSEDIPYDVFWGTATPGADIKVSSPYGSGSTTADEEGHWELKVEFPNAPAGEKFEVSIESSDGGSSGFGFVYVPADEV